jgi:hypothetical protein
MLRTAGFVEVTVWGLHHGPGIAADLVDRQIAAVLSDCWPADLLSRVATVTVDDFALTTAGVESSLDLLGIGRVPRSA